MTRFAYLLLATIAATAEAAAQDAPITYPTRPVRFIVTTPPGGAGEVLGRIAAQKLSEVLHQQFYVEARPGAGGSIANEIVARSAPDGYTVGLVTTSTLVVASIANPKLGYDPIRDFAPISLIGDTPYVLAVNPAVRATTVSELVALAKAKPGALSIGTNDVTSLAHLTGVLFAHRTGIALNQVSYRSSVQAVIDVVAGRIDMQFGTLPPTIPMIRDGKLRAIGTSGRKRAPALPDIATIAEQGPAPAEAGVPDFESTLWVGIAAPAGTPGAIVTTLNTAMTSILKMPDVIDAFATQGLDVQPGPPDDLRERTRRDLIKWRDVAVSAGIIAK
jgi:tripartite-type tricarboxylate transporter receptor subunit TctC